MNRISLTTRLSLFYGLIVIAISLILGLMFVRYTWQNLVDAFIQRGGFLARNLAYNSRYGVYLEDPDELSSLMEGVMQVEGAVAVTIVNAHGKVLAKKAIDNTPPSDPLRWPSEHSVFQKEEKYHFYAAVLPSPDNKPNFPDAPHFPEELLEEISRKETGSRIGSVEVVLSAHLLHRQVKEMEVLGVSITLLMMAGGMIFVYLISDFYLKPLQTLSGIARKVAAGDLTQTAKVVRRDEIGALTLLINQMTQSLQKRDRALTDLNRSLEDRVRQRTIDLESAILEIQNERQKTDQLKSDFIARVSHELRTPLTAIQGYIDNLKDGVAGALTEKQLAYLSRMLKNSNRLVRLITDLLNLSQIESGKAELHQTSFSIHELVEDVFSEMHPIAARKGVALFFNSGAHERPLLADRGKIEEVLTNLVDNAIKFTPSGGKITVTTRPGETRVVTTVQDTGAGIPIEAQPRIFDRFYQADSPLTTKGFGLGLFIAKTIVEMHQGELTVISRPGEGSAFSFSLPLGGK